MLADLPGLIEGASDGAGLGTRFLGHVERCAVILHLIDGTADDVVDAYRTIRAELAGIRARAWSEKPEIIGLQQDRDAIDLGRGEARKCRELDAAPPGAARWCSAALVGVSRRGACRSVVGALDPGRSSKPRARTWSSPPFRGE